MERIAIVLIVLVPVVAFLLLLPSMLKKRLDKKLSSPAPETKSDPVPVVEEKPVQEKKTEPNFETQKFTSEDFKGYLKEKKEKVTVPERKQPTDSSKFFETFANYNQRKQREVSQKESVSHDIFEDLGDLSPELATILLTNILNPKF